MLEWEEVRMKNRSDFVGLRATKLIPKNATLMEIALDDVMWDVLVCLLIF